MVERDLRERGLADAVLTDENDGPARRLLQRAHHELDQLAAAPASRAGGRLKGCAQTRPKPVRSARARHSSNAVTNLSPRSAP